MKYAIISDIHGNIHALRAALSDAKSHGAHKYIFLGDYVHGFPWGNDVTNAIRRLETATVIRGNGEGYLIETGRRLNKTEYPVSNEVWDAVGRIPTLEYELPLL